MPTPSTRLNQQIAIVFGVALTWVCLDLIKDSYFEFLQVNDFLYSIYLLSGIRLLVIILFGWLGALGLFIGYFSSSVLIREFAIEVALALGLISALTPLLAYGLWKRLTSLSSNFKNVSIGAIVVLVFLYSGLTAVARGAYLYNTDITTSPDLIWADFLGNAVGAFLFLYLLKIGTWAFKSIKGVSKYQ
jgi:hypothetical protein